MTDAMLKCTDALRQYAQDLRNGPARSDHFGQLAAELLKAQEASTQASSTQPASPPSAGQADEGRPSAPDGNVTAEATAEADAATAETRPPQENAPQDDSTVPQTDAGPAPEPAGEPTAEPEPLALPPELRAQVAPAVPGGMSALVGVVGFQPRLPLVGLKAQLVYEKLSNLGKLCFFDPPAEHLEEVESLDRVTFGVATDRPISEVSSQLRIAGVRDVLLEPLADETPDAPAEPAIPASPPAAKTAPDPPPARSTDASERRPDTGPAPAAPKPAEGSTPSRSRTSDNSKPTETLRVDIDRLDQLMNLAGQLVINKARFSQIGDSIKGLLPNKHASQSFDKVFSTLGKMSSLDIETDDRQSVQAEMESLRSQARRVQAELEAVQREIKSFASVHAQVNELFEAIHQLDRVSDGIQQSVMDTRMVPIGPLFARFKRVIRDITRTNGKQIQLILNGEKTELDKRMIDELGDPLIHMVRNSADHGIELPEVREAAGKPRQGTVTLNAFHRGNSIIIQVTDDGKGLDPDRILRKALDKGIITEADTERMTPHQIYQLIWEPGLSTAEKVTEVSGRGMGMDIVKSKIEDINGTVDLDSVPGQSTTLTIKLPLTLAILPSLMVEIEHDIFAMPMESVAEIVSVGKTDLTTVHGQWTARVRGRVISVVRLSEVFTWNQGAGAADHDDEDEVTLVIVGEAGHEIGLAVDRVVGEEDVVIKSMAENYKNVPGVAGASILGDGRVSLILDIVALVDMSSNKTTASAVS
jgi:two-component system chemotaxis sensor kinase CheA